MGVWSSFKYKIVAKKLNFLGCKYTWKCKWTHEIWYNPISDKDFTVVNHWSDNMRMGTLRNMLKIAWIEEADFLDADD